MHMWVILWSVLSSNYIIIKALTQFKLCDIANMSSGGYTLDEIMSLYNFEHNSVIKAYTIITAH